MAGVEWFEPENASSPKGRARSQASARKPSGPGPRKKRPWVEVDEYGEPVPLTAAQRAKLAERSTNLCLWHLGRGPRTRQQLAQALTAKGVPDDLAVEVLDRLEGYRYVDDAAFADAYVRSRHTGQRKGAAVIRFELARKGVPAEVAAQALEQVTAESEEENARALLARKVTATRGLDRAKRVNRLAGMLVRKGYRPGLAYQLVREVLATDGDEE